MNALWPLKAGKNTNTDLVPTRIVLHAIAEWVKLTEEYQGIKPGVYYAPVWLELIGLCYHSIFTPSGVTIKCRPDNKVAYHASADGHNFKSLGGCFMVPGIHDYGSFTKRMKEKYLTTEEYEAGLKQVRLWMITYRINKKTDIVTHSKIDPTRKEDPGEGFPLYKFIEEL